jgi:hAT family C-terminal dimerisation region
MEPFEMVTRRLCGAEYPTLNLVYPCMELLKKRFAPKENETVQTYINLIYGEMHEESDSDEMDDDIPTAGTRQHWQYAHRQFRQKMKNTLAQAESNDTHTQRQKQNKNPAEFNDTELEDLNPNKVMYLSPVSTNGLLQKVRAAIYLSIDELWTVPTDIALVATFLDPRFKHFNWTTKGNLTEAQCLVKILYEKLKIDLNIPDDDIEGILDSDKDHMADDHFFHELEGVPTQAEEEDEVAYYIKLEAIKVKDDPLEWWLKNRSRFPVLAQLARKYLAIPSTSVPSERLFSDASNHISAKRTRLSPDLVNKMLFLKRNSSHFDIFQPQEE